MKNLIITIGREFGSGGKDVATELGEILNFPVYDKELLLKAAQDSGFSKTLFEEHDEKCKVFTFTSMFSQGFGSQNYMNRNELFLMQSETIKKIAQQGPAILVGRCSDYILRNHKPLLTVFLNAPKEFRIKRIMDSNDLDEAQALDMLKKQDKTRQEYYNYFTMRDWGVASTYDICIDTSLFDIKRTAELIAYIARNLNY